MTNEIQKDWRLAHDNHKVSFLLHLLSAKTALGTGLTLFTADSKEECLAEIARLNLEFNAEEFE